MSLGDNLLRYSGDENYVIYDNAESLSFLKEMNSNLLFRNTALGKIAEDFEDIDTHNGVISRELIIHILESDFLQETLFKEYNPTLHILNVDYGLGDNTNAKAFHDVSILVNARNRYDSTPVEAFLHELGHFFHFALTSDMDVLPSETKTFLESNSIQDDIFLEQYWERTKQYANYNFDREKFADIYMIACMVELDLQTDLTLRVNKTHPITRTNICNHFNRIYR